MYLLRAPISQLIKLESLPDKLNQISYYERNQTYKFSSFNLFWSSYYWWLPKILNCLFLFSPFPPFFLLVYHCWKRITWCWGEGQQSLAWVETHACKLPRVLLGQCCVSVRHMREVFGLPARGRVQGMWLWNLCHFQNGKYSAFDEIISFPPVRVQQMKTRFACINKSQALKWFI